MDSMVARNDSGARSQGPFEFLVGRTREQLLLREELAAARDGHGRLCLVGGEAGIGKTTLARDLARTADELGVRVLTGSCYDLSNVPPYGPWLDFFLACQRNPSLPVSPAAFSGGQLAPINDQRELFGDVRQFIADLVAERPALIILEDLQWADPASLDLLRHVGPHLRHWPVLILVTYRADELAPGRPFAQHLPALVREADGRRFDLHRLDAVALRTLVSSQMHLAHPDEDRLLAYLERHAEGNPFFTTEILRSLEEEELLKGEGHEWSLAPLDRVVVPHLLRQVIDGRVARLGDAMRKPLAMAAVIGHEVPLALWASVADLAEEEHLDIVERAVGAHLLEAERDGTRVRFVHAFTREALYEGILPPRRRVWHLRIAESLMANPHADPDAVAFHLQEAGDARAAEWLIRAGERAQRAYAWLTASERFEAAARLLVGGEEQEHVRRRLILRLAYVLRFSYPADAIDALALLTDLVGDPFTTGEARNLRGLFQCYSDRFGAGLADMEQGISTIEGLPPHVQQTANAIRDWLSQAFTGQAQDDPVEDDSVLDRLNTSGIDFRRSYHAWQLASAGHLEAATATGEWFVATFGDVSVKRGGIRLATAFARHALAIAAAAQNRPRDAAGLWALARREFGDHHVLVAFTLLDELRDVAVTFGAGEPAVRRGLAAEAEAALARAGGALRTGVSPPLAWLRCLLLDGRWDEALQILDDLPPPGNAYLRRETTATRAVLARHRGEPEVAWSQILPLFPEGAATDPGNLIHQEGLFLQRLAADLYLDAGDREGARAWLAAHDRWLAWSGSVLGQADGQLGWARYDRAVGEIESARARLASVLALLAGPDQPLVRLGAHRLLGELEGAAGALNDAEAHLAIALGLADACDVPFERALTLLALAEVRLAASDASMIAAVDEARHICSTLGAAPALARAAALGARPAARPWAGGNRSGLTQRELDVLRLVADGQSNPEIAATLFISRDTARTHVSNIFRKLDVGTRAEAVDVAYRHGLLVSSPST